MSPVAQLWKYTALGATSIVLEEVNPILGGIAARHAQADFAAVIVAVALGTWAASLALYFVGLWRIDWILARFPGKRRLLDGALTIVRRNPWRASLAVRFAYGLRLPLPLACGAARLPLSLYLLASGISCWVWSAAFAYLGFAAGGVAMRALNVTKRGDVRIGMAVAVLCLVLVAVAWRRRIAEQAAKVITGDEIDLMTTAERRALGSWGGGE